MGEGREGDARRGAREGEEQVDEVAKAFDLRARCRELLFGGKGAGRWRG